MDVQPTDFKRLFTVDEANAMLPLVRVICRDLSTLSREVVERRERLAMLLDGREEDRRDLYRDELAQIEEELDKDHETLRGYVNELVDLGIEPKNATEGLVDFPSLMDGQVIYLCWKLDEPEVMHWHTLEGGFRGRQSLAADSATGGGFQRSSSDPSVN